MMLGIAVVIYKSHLFYKPINFSAQILLLPNNVSNGIISQH